MVEVGLAYGGELTGMLEHVGLADYGALGSVIDRETSQRIANAGPLVVSDEVYREIWYEAPPPSMLGMAPAPCPTAKSLEDIYYPSQHETVDAILTQVKGQGHGIALPVECSMTEGYKRFRGPF